MKKLVIFIACLFITGLGISFLGKRNEKAPTTKKIQSLRISPTDIPSKPSKSIFIPYWSLKDNESIDRMYDRYIYFGVTGGEMGIDRSETGYKGIGNFLSSIPNESVKLLTLRLLDEDDIISILQKPQMRDLLISETTDIARENGFSGVLLDLELSSSTNDTTVLQISDFVQEFYTHLKKYYMTFSVALYGDTFYRKRPYDVDFISKNSDGIFIMAYDFHKAGGEPGPNFSLKGDVYSFEKMTADFTAFVPKEKITVVFGMFGYDWAVDEQKRPLKPAKSLSVNEIREQFLNKCEWENCLVTRDPDTRETEVNYVESEVKDNFGYIYPHIVWFEDEESAKVKEDYLKSLGIGSIAFWAYGYF